MQKNVEENIETALHDAMRNFLRGTQLKEAVATLAKGSDVVPGVAPAPVEPPKPQPR